MRRRVKPTFETVPSERGGRLGDVESSFVVVGGDVVVVVAVWSSLMPLSVLGLGRVGFHSRSRRQQHGMHRLAMPVAQFSHEDSTPYMRRPADARSLYVHAMPMPCPRSLSADRCEGASPEHTYSPRPIQDRTG